MKGRGKDFRTLLESTSLTDEMQRKLKTSLFSEMRKTL